MSELTAEKIGKESEKKVFDLLLKFKEEGFIVGFRKEKDWSYYDKTGVDFHIFMEFPKRKIRIDIPLQVKSSKDGVAYHNDYDGQNILVINANSKYLDLNLKTLIINVRESCLDNNNKKHIITLEQQERMLAMANTGKDLRFIELRMGFGKGSLKKILKRYPDLHKKLHELKNTANSLYKNIDFYDNRYVANLRVNDERIYIGRFLNKQDAEEALNTAFDIVYRGVFDASKIYDGNDVEYNKEELESFIKNTQEINKVRNGPINKVYGKANYELIKNLYLNGINNINVICKKTGLSDTTVNHHLRKLRSEYPELNTHNTHKKESYFKARDYFIKNNGNVTALGVAHAVGVHQSTARLYIKEFKEIGLL